jgi:hypothetical protein
MNASSLPNIRADVSPSLAGIDGLSAAVADVTTGAGTLAESFAALMDNHLFQDAVVALANGMTKEAAVKWSVEAAKTVADKLPDGELQALEAAEDWLASGGAADAGPLQDLLQDNAMQGPGAWAAKAADWSDQAAASDAIAPYGKAVEAAVKLAAALTASDWPLSESAASEAAEAGVDGMSAMQQELAAGDVDAGAVSDAAGDGPTPEQQLNDLLKPFVEQGLKIAAGE